MRNLKRFLAMALSVLMVAGSFAAVSAKEFTDVEADNDYAVAIDKLSDLGVIQGKDDDSYAPAEKLTRWHMALFLARLDSGRMEDEDTLRLWYEATNYTPFEDLNGDYPVAAINYMYNFEMIKGTSDTTFSPDEGIEYQQALTMLVRALGYGSKAMDGGYPWKYINKANELGLTDGIDASVLYTDTLNRGEMAQVLYNALYAVDAEGNTYAEKYMGQTTVMITGIKGYKVAAVESVQIDTYVSVNVVNANGTINNDVTYFLPVAEFGYEEATKALVGMTFRVNTSDNFVTLDVVEPCTFDVYGTEDFEGYVGANGAASNKLTIADVDYKVTNSWSFLYNSQVTTDMGTAKDGSNEIMLFSVVDEPETNNNMMFHYDAQNNILNAKGEVAAYYVPAITGSYDAPYAAQVADGVYVPFVDFYKTEEDEDGNVKEVVITWKEQILKIVGDYISDNKEYKMLDCTNSITTTDRFAELKAYDDDADEKYERAFYAYATFGQIGKNDKGALTINGSTAIALADDVVFEDATKTALAQNDYVRYWFDAVSGTYTVDKVYAWADAGVVKGIAANQLFTTVDTLTVAGIANYPGAKSAVLSGFNHLYETFGYAVEVITETTSAGEARVLVIRAKSTAPKNVVFDQIIAVNSNGYVKALMYDLTTGQKIVADIATVYGYEYHEFKQLQQLFNYYHDLECGDVWTATYDAVTGYYHMKGLKADKQTLAADATLTFVTYDHGNTKYEANIVKDAFGKVAAGIKTNASTNIFVRYWDGKSYQFANQTGLGMSTDIVNALKGSTYYVGFSKTVADNDTLAWIYIDLADGDVAADIAAEEDVAEGTIAGINSSYVVFVGANTGVSVSTDKLIGQVYNYTNLYKQDGTKVTTEVYNYKLIPGHFYMIANGYVEYEMPIVPAEEVTSTNVVANADKVYFLIDGSNVTEIKNNNVAYYAVYDRYILKADMDTYNKYLEAQKKAEEDAKAEAEKEAAAAAEEAAWAKLYEAVAGEDLNTADELMTIAMAALKALDITDEVVLAEAKIVMKNYINELPHLSADVVKALAEYMPAAMAEKALERATKIDNDAVAEHQANGKTDKYEALVLKAVSFYELADQEATVDVEGVAEITVAERVENIKAYLAK